MRTRRDQVLDAAIDLLGDQGVRAVTHRAVDAAAGLPAGATSNLFRSRDELFDGIVDRVVEREHDGWERLVATDPPTSAGALAHALALEAVRQTTAGRTLALARYAMLVESARRPALRPRLLAGGGRVNAWFTAWLRLAGSTDPARDLDLVANFVTGLVLHELAIPDPAFDPEPRIAALLQTLVPAGSSHGHH